MHRHIYGRFRRATVVAALSAGILGSWAVSGPPARAASPSHVYALGGATAYGAPDTDGVTGIARTPTGHGYWLVSANGAVGKYGDAGDFGTLAGSRLNRPIVDLAGTPTGQGYWLVASDGGIFALGDAHFQGSTGGTKLNAPIVGMAATPTGSGYWLVASDGGIFAFGDARFLGSTGDHPLNSPIVGMASTPSGSGYWLVAADGGIFAFGDAPFRGSMGGEHINQPVVSMAGAPSGNGYWMVASDGGVFAFGDAPFHGSATDAANGQPVVGIAATPDGSGNWVATGGRDLGTFEVTCYSLRGSTASGEPVDNDTAAVDPGVIPLGNRIFVDGVGSRTAKDTGGAIRGNRIDIWSPSTEDCRNFGRQSLHVWGQE